MTFHPAPQSDRLAELEITVRRLEAALEGSRRAAAETVFPVAVRPARTALRQTVPIYPSDSMTNRRLPIVFCDWQYETEDYPYTNLDITDRSEWPQTYAQSPLWLPPDVDVEVAMIGGYWRVVRWPAAIYAKTEAGGIAAAAWETVYGLCGWLVTGKSFAHVHYRNEDGHLEPQYYDPETELNPVLLYVENVAGLVAGNKLCVFAPGPDHVWTAVVEPCALTCSV